MINKQKLSESLIEHFMLYQYRLENPFPEVREKHLAYCKYRNDAMFHSKVESLVYGVMALVSLHDQLENENECS